MNTSANRAGERIADVHVDDDRIHVDLVDGRTITAPLSWYPRLSAASKSELDEELALEVTSVEEPLLAIHDDGSPFNIVFVPVAAYGEPKALEHEALEWVDADRLLNLNLAPSDRRFAEWLIGRSGSPGQ